MSSTPMKITTIEMETAKMTSPPRDGFEEASLRRSDSTESDVAESDVAESDVADPKKTRRREDPKTRRSEDPKTRRGFAARATKVPYVLGVCLVLGLCATLVVEALDQRELKRKLDDAPRLPKLPRSGRTRRSPQDQDPTQDHTRNVFQLDGVRGGDKTDMDSGFGSSITIADWRKPSWLESRTAWRNNFAMTADEEGIKVLHDGVYFVYANFAFTGMGDDCQYKLRYGNGNGNGILKGYRKCHWMSNNGHDVGEKYRSQNRMCYLGFVTELKAGDELKLVFKHVESCKTTNKYYGDRQNLSYMGIIKQS